MSDAETTTWIQTYTGRKVDPLALRPEDVCIEDIAHALALMPRFNGHTREPYSIAQHCVLASWEVLGGLSGHPRFRMTAREALVCQMMALLHDAPEAYLGDWLRPVKSRALLVNHAYQTETIRALERRAMHSVRQALCPDSGYDSIMLDLVRRIDDRLLATERRDLFDDQIEWPSLEGVEPLEDRIAPDHWTDAERDFLNRYHELRSAIDAEENETREVAS